MQLLTLGATIHHELTIHAEKSNELYRHITGDQYQRMQDDFKDTKIIIIDEYSMVDKAMLATIDLHCRDIFTKTEPFENVYVVLVGNMHQLPLVFDSLLYVKSENLIQQNERIAYARFDRYVVLSQIFRQTGSEKALCRKALRRLSKVLNIRYRDRIGWDFFISDIEYRRRYRDTRAYRVFISDTIYYEILITKSWFNVIDIIYLIKMM